MNGIVKKIIEALHHLFAHNGAWMQCPVCGYHCLGKGGNECIDKPAAQTYSFDTTMADPK